MSAAHGASTSARRAAPVSSRRARTHAALVREGTQSPGSPSDAEVATRTSRQETPEYVADRLAADRWRRGARWLRWAAAADPVRWRRRIRGQRQRAQRAPHRARPSTGTRDHGEQRAHGAEPLRALVCPCAARRPPAAASPRQAARARSGGAGPISTSTSHPSAAAVHAARIARARARAAAVRRLRETSAGRYLAGTFERAGCAVPELDLSRRR